MAQQRRRIRTWVRGLDERLMGGIPQGHIVLVCGTSGSMKSSLSFHLVYNNVKHGNMQGVYLSLEQGRASLLRHMAGLGMDIEDPAVRGSLAVIDLAVLRKEIQKMGAGEEVNWMESLQTQIVSYQQALGFEILIFDSLAALYALTPMRNPRNELFHFFERLRDLGLTVFLITEMPTDKVVFGEFGVEDFLSDGIIHITMERNENSVDRFISVVKMRETKHDTDYFPLLVSNGFEIVTR